MTNAFVNGATAYNNQFTRTENGALALKSSGSALVDLFGVIGSLRSRDDAEIENLFVKAFSEDPLLATKMVFYARNIRGGLGERKTPRLLWRWLADNYPEIVVKNIHLIPEFGRWDDLYVLVGTKVERDMWSYLYHQFYEDLGDYHSGKSVSLLAKWLKSVNASNKANNELGKLTAKRLDLTEKEYRTYLSALRKHIDIVEKKMSSNRWTEISYEAVPSRAMAIYRKAFSKHDLEGFGAYINAVEKGEKKINASTLYPYDIFEKMGFTAGWTYGSRGTFTFTNYDKVLAEQWKALPNYVEGENNVLVMADTSGSMNGRPVCTSVGLAIYFAERNKGVFKDLFLTFSSTPQFVKLQGNTLLDKVRCVPSIVANTNLESAFNLVLQVAVSNNVPKEEMPKALVIISDMEIDSCTDVRNWSFYDSMKNRFEQAGYDIPNIVFWNVASRNDLFHAQSNYKGVMLASGQSPSTFRAILQNMSRTPYDAMVNVLNDKMYEGITI